ncbi:MAG: TatD family hydrolase [candidate division Zixibacteria bacterium]|nr:TatD family hydrolase [candidate division Zixibacteria bacterium]
MIDTHCHIDFPDFDSDREGVIAEARRNGVDRLINIGADIPSSRRSLELAKTNDNIYCTVGVHPHDSKTLTPAFLKEMETMTTSRKVVGIGEIGLDYYRNLSPHDIQKNAFVQQLDLAVTLHLPVVIHVREAMDDALQIMKGYTGRLRGVFHCFPGTTEQALRLAEMGFLISVNGVLTYKNSRMAKVAQEVELETILLETDSPYLTPDPYRGKRNEPAHVSIVCRKLAELRRVDTAEIDKITTRNAEKLFKLVEIFGQ